MGKGGGQQQAPQQPTNQTVTQTNLPEYARPYFESLLGKAGALTDINQNPYQSYQGQRLADFTPLQQQAFQNIGGMQISPQTGQATGLAGMAGIGGLGAGQQYAQMATDPTAISAYMSPYMQNVVDYQKQQAIRDYSRALPGLGAQAAQAGAFGGSRQALVESEAQRNLQNQLAGIQATGSQNAFNQAQQAQQFGANLGLQGLNLAGQAAGTLGQLGQQQYGQQMGINAALQQAGAQQQALAQQQLTNQYQDFLNQMNYPYQQLGFMSDILRGMPTTGITTQQQYQAQPSMFSQIAGLGLGLGALGKGFNLFKEGGEVKGYADGGMIDPADALMSPGIAAGVNFEAKQAQKGLPTTMLPGDLAKLVQLKTELSTPQAQPAQRTVAQDLALQVLAQNRPQNIGQGLGGMPSNLGDIYDNAQNEQVRSAAHGGIIAFDGGGEVEHFQVGGTPSYPVNLEDPSRNVDAIRDFLAGDDPFIPQTQEQVLRRNLALHDISGKAANALVEGLGAITYPARAAASGLMSFGSGLGRMVGIPVGLPEQQPVKPVTKPVTAPVDDSREFARYPSALAAQRRVPTPTVKPAAQAALQTTPTTTTSKPAAEANDEITGYFNKLLNSPSKYDPEKMRKDYMAILDEKMPSQAKDIREFYKAEGERLKGEGDKDRWLALAMGGFAIAAGKSPYAIQNFGEGLGLAAKEVSAVNKEMRAAERERQKAERAELAADRAQEAGKFKEAKSLEMEGLKLREMEDQHRAQAANYLGEHKDRVLARESQTQTAREQMRSHEKIAAMQLGAPPSELRTLQAIAAASGRPIADLWKERYGAAAQRVLTAQDAALLNRQKAQLKSLQDQAIMATDPKRRKELSDQIENLTNQISSVEFGGSAGGGNVLRYDALGNPVR